ncbi:type II toxin-antitoxin system VapC family toxin [Calothrix sp. CCY 0018]|uniref:type II toxin-antitoxin system VapC family toxin n=1 Tax=Calothrix sp. CCY 0018 TaxID=3103864 RepID=UPI0039C75401
MTTATVCVDASLIVRFLTDGSPDSVYQQKWDEWETQEYTIVAPTLLVYEICNAFHRAVIAQQITSNEGEELLKRAVNLGVRFYGDAQLHQQAFKIAQRYSLPATYDAHYLALAERLSIELWTTDKRLFNGVKSSLSWVKLLRN